MLMQNGDYNRTDVNQFQDPIETPNYCQRVSWQEADNGLCHACNLNQQILVKLYSEFEPFNEDDIEKEFSLYKKDLEKMYPLCYKCEHIASRHLRKQDKSIRANLLEYVSKLKTVRDEILPKSPACTKAWSLCILTMCSIACVSILFVLNVVELQQNAHAFPLDLEPLKTLFDGYTSSNAVTQLIAIFGLSTSVASSLLRKDFGMTGTDLAVAVLWLFLHITQLKTVENYISCSDAHLLRPIACILTFFVIILNIAQHWARSQPVFIPNVNISVMSLDDSSTYSTQSVETQEVKKDVVREKITPRAMDTADHPIREQINSMSILAEDESISSKTSSSSVKSVNHLSLKSLPPNGYTEHKEINYPLIKPAKFVANMPSSTSWVAGGFWAKQTTNFSQPHINKFESAMWHGMITPPPSEAGSMRGNIRKLY